MNFQDNFDKIYILNLRKDKNRRLHMKKRMEFFDITNYEFFDAIDGSILTPIWETTKIKYPFFSNPNYLGCALSHLAIYKDAIQNNFERILILEDDVRFNRNLHENSKWIKEAINQEENIDLIHLGFIPLSDDLSQWDYNIYNDRFLTNPHLFKSKNLWGLFSYSISNFLMNKILEDYNKNFPMELDRYFVNKIFKTYNCIGITPQFFAHEDNNSNNSMKYETNMLQKSIDKRYECEMGYI